MGGANSLLSCAGRKSKKRKKKKHKETLESRRDDVDTLEVKSSELGTKLGHHDVELLKERVSLTEKQYLELLTTADRKLEQYGVLGGDLEDIRAEASKYLSWLEQKQTGIDQEEESVDTRTRLIHLEDVCTELESKQENLSTILGKSSSLVGDLPVAERDSVEQLVAMVQTQHDKTYNLISQKAEDLRGRMEKQAEFQTSMDKLTNWVMEREKAAEKNVSFRLLAVDVEKQVDKCKNLSAEVQSHMIHIQPIRNQLESMKSSNDEELADTLEKTVQSLTSRYEALVTYLQQQQEELVEVAAARRQFESDCQKIERWCEDTERQCSADVPLDCATEILKQQVKTFQILKDSSQEYDALLVKTLSQGQQFYANLYEPDRPILEQQLESLNKRFTMVVASVSEHVVTMETAVQNQTEAETYISETEIWLRTLQTEMQQVMLGVSVDDAEDASTRFQNLEQTLAQYQPKISNLTTTMKTSGHPAQSDAVIQLTTQYELLIDQVSQHQKRCRQAILLRSQFTSHISELENKVKQAQDEVAALSDLGVDIKTRIDRYREIRERLVSLEPELFIARDRAQQVTIDSSSDEGRQVQLRVDNLQDKVKALLQDIDDKTKQCQDLLQEREDFEDVIGSTMSWLERKEDVLASRGSLELDSVKVNPVLSKHQVMSSEALEKLSIVRTKAEAEKRHYEELQEPVPVSVTEKFTQIHSLEESIKDAIEKKEQYLLEARDDREQYENSMHQVTDWLHGAEDRVDSGYVGLDYDTLNNTLSEFTDYFSEASLCQDEMDQVMELSEKIVPTLDVNDQTTLQQTLKNTNKKLTSVVSAAQKKQEQMEAKATEWKAFQVNHLELHQTMEVMEGQLADVDKMSIVTPQDLQQAVKNVKNIHNKMESECRETVNEVNEQGRSLDRVANSNSRSVINKHVSSVNSRWNSLVTQTETRLMSLEETSDQWSEFASDLEAINMTLQEVQHQLETAQTRRSTEDLTSYVQSLQDASGTLSDVENQLAVLQRSNVTLQKSLPSAESRVSCQDSLICTQENFERLRDTVRDNLSSAQDEQEDHLSYLTQITQTITWFVNTNEELARLQAGTEQTRSAESIERFKTLQQEIRIHIQQFHHLVQVQEAKYSAQGRQLPESVHKELQQMNELETRVTEAVEEKEEELLHLKVDREEYQRELEFVTKWLTHADITLRKQIHSIPESYQEHQVLLEEVPDFQTHLDALRTSGGALIQNTPDPVEKTRVQGSLVEVNRQFSAIQSRAVTRGQQLEEASRLATLYADTLTSVEAWVGQAETISGGTLTWTDFNTVRENLKTFQELSHDAECNHDRLRGLGVTVKQLGQFSDTAGASSALDTMSQRVARVTVSVRDQLGKLEDKHARIEEYEKNIAEITQWLEQTRGQLVTRDTPLDAKAQLKESERLVEELESQRARTQTLLQQYEDLQTMAEASLPATGTKLLTDIEQMGTVAGEQCQHLHEVVTEQDQNEEEIRQLNVAIGEAQEKLLASPVMASSVGTLKQQIAEHDALAHKIKMYQARVSQINEKNRELSERSLQRSPTLVRKRFLANTSAGSSGFSSARDRSSPYSSGTPFDYFDSIEDSGAHMLDFSLNTMPSSLSWSSLSDRSDRTSTTIRSNVQYGGRDSLDKFRSQSLTSLRSDRGRGRSPLQRDKGETDQVPAPQGPSTQLAELNTSWASLQEQVVAKEQELHDALKQQENYQRSVQEVNAKMERAQKRLTLRPTSSGDDLEKEQRDYEETLQELRIIKEDIKQVTEQSGDITDKSDPEGRKAMEATLKMLVDRAENLQILANDAGKRLQVATKTREQHNKDMDVYKKRIRELENWLSEMRVSHATSALPTDSVHELQTEMVATKEVQDEINARLKSMSDLAVQCDSVCELESPTVAEKLRTQLASLQKELGNFKLGTIDKQSQLRGAIKEAEKRQREMENYEVNVQKMQQWISDTKQMTLPPVRTSTLVQTPEQQKLQQDLSSGLLEHQQLVRQISVSSQRYSSDNSEGVMPPTGESQLQLQWKELERDLAGRKKDLEDVIRTKPPEGLQVLTYKTSVMSLGSDPYQSLSEIRQIVSDLSKCWEQLESQVEDRQVRLEQAWSFQQQYQQALLTISSWLDTAQHRLLSPQPEQSTEQQLRDNQNLQQEIRNLQKEIDTMSEQAQKLLLTTSGESRGLIQQSLTNLNDRVSLLEGQAQNRGKELQEASSHWKQYKDEVDSLQKQLKDAQHLIHSAPGPHDTGEDLLQNVQEMETKLHRCEGKLDDLKKREAELSVRYPQGVFPSDLGNLQSNYMNLQRKVTERRSDVLQMASAQEQYEKLLQDYAQFIETADGKLQSEDVSASDLIHLQHQLATHKDFFSDLEVHKAMLDSLASQCPVSVRERHRVQHQHLRDQTHVLVEKASLRGQRLERLVRQWGDLETKLIRLQGSLANIEQQIPGPIATGDSMETIQAKLKTYQTLQKELSEEKVWVFEVVEKGKQILHSLTCPDLETAIARLADKWVDLNTTLTQDLKRTETLGDQLQTFETEAAILQSWLTTAKMKLGSLKQLSVKDRESMAAVRNKVEKLLEFQKEVENQLPLRSKVLTVGHQLMASSSFNTTGLDDRLKQFEKDWDQLQKDITSTEQLLHQAQMDLMPSRQALHELSEWLDLIRTHLREDKNKSIHSMADIEVMVKKYKGYKIELSSKQLTVDFVNQQVLQPQVPEEDAEKLDFAEKLGEFNRQWKLVSSDVNERLKTLERIISKYEEYEKALGRLQTWFREQEDKIKQYKLIAHEIGVRQTLKECKELQKQLKAKEADIATVKSLAASLIDLSADSPGCQRGVQESLDRLNKQWLHLEQQLLELENIHEDVLGQWSRYSSELQALIQLLTNTEYCLNRYSLVGGDITTLADQVNRLKSLEAELRHHESQRDDFILLGQQLMKVCESPIAADVQKTIADLQNKWRRLSADLSTRRKQFEQCLQHWQEYESEYNTIQAWLDTKDKLCHEVTRLRDDPSSHNRCLEQSKQLQAELDSIQSRVSDLCRRSDDLAKNMDPSTIVMMTSRHSGLEQRLLGLRQILAQNIEDLQEDMSSLNQFQKAFDFIHAFLNHAENVLAQSDISRSADEGDYRDRLSQLKELQYRFTNTFPKLDTLNIMGYKLALGDVDANRLRDLNHRWYRLSSQCGEQCKSLQANLLTHQDFTSKCDSWMTFLAQTEQDLAVDIAGNLEELLDQHQKSQKFESEMYSRQQVLHAIVSDGNKMLESGEIDDPAEFRQKLHLLSEQWRSVVRRASQRKAIIDNAIQQWTSFNNLCEQLRSWLAEKDKVMKGFEFETASLQQINSMLEKVKTTQREFKLQEDMFKKAHELGNLLLQRADTGAEENLKVCLAQLNDNWCQSYGRLDHHREHLEDVLHRWHECEEDIDDILLWLRETRQILAAELPTEYDQLQAELNTCKDIATSFANSEDRRQQLLSREKQLSTVIRSEDMNILHQRIRLLNKQWDELASQTQTREQRIRDAMCRWAGFADHVQKLIEWMEDIEMDVVSTRDAHVEDLLARLETEIRDELMAKEREKNHLVEQGRRLMRVSSDIRASDIQHRIAKLEDKWQHLQSVVSFRERKLRETVLAVKQLDVSMRNLSRWLSDMEEEIGGAIIYSDCDWQEIQEKLQHQQELQRDIERHSAGVASVLNLCEVLLHDSDACPTDIEYNALQHTRKALEHRWRNLCKLSPERRARIEESWQLWEVFKTDCKTFSDWLIDVETEVGTYNIDDVSVEITKEEIRKYETLQRNVHDRLGELENINKQYRRLAKEGRTDTSGSLRATMQDVNDRWDHLQQRVTFIMQSLRQSTSLRRDFTTTRTSLMEWLIEVETQLTTIQQMTSIDSAARLRQVKRLLEEIETRKGRFEYLDQSAVYLMQKGDAEEVIQVQQELDEVRRYWRTIVEQVTIYHMQVEQLERFSDDDSAMSADLRQRELQDTTATLEWDATELEAYLESSPPESPPHKRRAEGHTLPRSISPTRLKTRDTERVEKRVDERRQKMRSELGRKGKTAKYDALLNKLGDAIEDAAAKLLVAEREISSNKDSSVLHFHRSECEQAIENVQRLERRLKSETGQTRMNYIDNQIRSVVQRWEILQLRFTDREYRVTSERQDLTQFKVDLDNMLAWLDEAEALQSIQQPLPGNMTELDNIIRQYKDFLVQLESKKARVLSINLISKNYIDLLTEEGRALQEKLRQMNSRWEAINARTDDVHHGLQVALLQSQEFHHEIHDRYMWLESIETSIQKCEPLNLNGDDTQLWQQYNRFMELHGKLERNQPQILAIKDTTDQLYMNTDSQEMVNAKDKMRIIANRVRALLRLTSSYISSLEEKLNITPGDMRARLDEIDRSAASSRSSTPRSSVLRAGTALQRVRTRSPFALTRQLLFGDTRPSLQPSDDTDNSSTAHDAVLVSRRRPPLLARVLRMALPLQLLLLLLLGMACLVPICEDEYNCFLGNNLQHSLSPMLRYTDGPPPV